MKKILKTLVLSLLIVALIALSLIAFVGCDDEIEVGYLPEESVRYEINMKKFNLAMLGDEINGLITDAADVIEGVFVEDETYIELSNDGVFTLQLMVKLGDVIRLLTTEPINVLPSTDIGGMEGVETLTKSSLKPTIDGYVEVFFPGFEYEMDGVLDRLGAVGLSIIGVDESNEEWAKFVAYVENPENDRLIPESFDLAKLPATIGIRLRAPYKLLDSYDADGNVKFTMATLGPHDADTLPLANFYLTSRDTSRKHIEEITFTNEMLGLTIAGKYSVDLAQTY